MPTPTRHQLMRTVAAGALVATLAACSSTADDVPDVAAAPKADTTSASYLGEVCPATITVLTDWMPESEHGELYELLGPGATIDDDLKRISGALVDHDGNDTGVRLEIRAGGPAVGFDSGANQLYKDDSLMLAYISTDDAIAAAAQDQPVLSIAATKEISPTSIMWDPETYPDLKTVADVGKAGIKVRYTNGLMYMEYLLTEGILSPDQVDSSYDGSPGAFVADGGASAQQGYASAEPYMYKNEISQWGKDLAFGIVAETGYKIYVQSLSVRSDRVEEFASCFAKLVPMVQQAQIDFLDDPTSANGYIVDAVKEYNLGWQYSAGLAEYSAKAQKDLGLVGNGPDSTIGNHDLDRVQTMIDIVTPILASQGIDAPALTPDDLVTNEFIDESIGLS